MRNGSGSTQRAAVLHGVGDLRIDEVPVRRPAPHEVVVAVRSVGVCGSDVHYYEHGRIGDYVLRAPMILGHEASGVVVDKGEAATRHAIGARVALEPGVPCGHCQQCRTGHYNLCPDVRFFATPPIDGAFAEYVCITEDFAHPVPDSLSDDAAALIEPLSVGLWACRRAGLRPGDDVLITGAGPIGLVALQSARAFGAGSVVVTDINADRLALARRLGATDVVDVSAVDLAASGVTADVLLECSGVRTAVRDGVAACRPAGRAVLVGMGADEVTLPASALQVREVTVTGTFRYANTYPAAIALAADGRIDLDTLVTGRYALADAEKALLAGRGDPTAVKSVVLPGHPG